MLKPAITLLLAVVLFHLSGNKTIYAKIAGKTTDHRLLSHDLTSLLVFQPIAFPWMAAVPAIRMVE